LKWVLLPHSTAFSHVELLLTGILKDKYARSFTLGAWFYPLDCCWQSVHHPGPQNDHAGFHTAPRLLNLRRPTSAAMRFFPC
jgi:hypothetical protein